MMDLARLPLVSAEAEFRNRDCTQTRLSPRVTRHIGSNLANATKCETDSVGIEHE
jgi:hypothetical protein